METDWNLSDKIMLVDSGAKELARFGDLEGSKLLTIEDVREFIKKEDIILNDYITGKINCLVMKARRSKLAGDKLC